MNETQSTRKKLAGLARVGWKFPDGIDYSALADEIKGTSTSLEGSLRDRLGLEGLCALITSGKLSDEKCRSLLAELLSEKHFLDGLGKECDDSVFNRSCSAYGIIAVISHNKAVDRRILSDDEVRNILDIALKQLENEKDFRGFVEVKGWADSIGHTSDLLACLAQDSAIGYNELIAMLAVLKSKICIDYYCYNHEFSRFRDVIVKIMQRELISEQEFYDWITSCSKYEKTGDLLKDARLKSNISEFFCWLSSALKKDVPNLYPYVWNVFCDTLEE